MSKTQENTSQAQFFASIRYVFFWLPVSAIVGVLAGSASALLLWLLEWATEIRERHLWIIALLPVAGLLVGCLYKFYGASVEAGNDLILDEIHAPNKVIPLRMTPLVLLGTFMTHLFGGSAGREGTAIQTGASLADQLSKPLRLSAANRRILLMAGISAGFGSVFGTPMAGAIFGMEVLSVGVVRYEPIVPCFIAAVVGDLTTKAWSIHHAEYSVPYVPVAGLSSLLLALLAGLLFGLTARIFGSLVHTLKDAFRSSISWAPLRPFFGGIFVAAFVLATGATQFVGLGIPTIVASFQQVLPVYDFAAKAVLTAVTLGSGFKGGEVTPLFFIGATLGNGLSHVIPLPAPLLAGMGLAAVFAGAANAPIASGVMAFELFGSKAGLYCMVACVISYLFSGHRGIYRAQRIEKGKHS